MGAGIVSRPHSASLAALTGQDFTQPTLVNNIIWQNRSFFFDPAANAGVGGLVPNATIPYWDLQVLGAAGSLNPTDCVLTDTTGYDPSNLNADPLFAAGYFTDLRTTQVAQEGGNFVSILPRPLTLFGDYHVQGASPAIGQGNNGPLAQFPELGLDYDRQTRPRPANSNCDIGADER